MDPMDPMDPMDQVDQVDQVDQMDEMDEMDETGGSDLTSQHLLVRAKTLMLLALRTGRYISIPTTLPAISVASVPETKVFKPNETISLLRSGAMVVSPPIMMPRLPQFANPHRAYIMINRERSLKVPGASLARSR